MFDEVRSAVATLKAVVRELEPGVLDGCGAVQLVELFAEAEHVCAAGKAIATRRVDETQAYREGGHRSAAHWLAASTGVNVGQATHALRTAEALDGLPATAEAFRSGELSEIQAYEITNAATADPSAEAGLLRSAKRDTVKGLKDRCARVLAAPVTGSTIDTPLRRLACATVEPDSRRLRRRSAARRHGLDRLRRTGSSGGVDGSASTRSRSRW